jgi:tRNA pseudouridine13 synthase
MPSTRDDALPCAHGLAPASGRLRATPGDFFVEEVLGFAADGTGHHALLTVEKRGANTGWVAAQLARHARVAARDVGFSGHKDRHAVTRQAYTVPLQAADDVAACREWGGEGYVVIAAERHSRKLRPGSHRANRFVMRVRDLDGDRAAVDRRLSAIARDGVPNYFGPQRFGREGANLERVRSWANGGASPRDRSQRSFALSSARSALFNAVLAERVRRGSWNQLLPGEAVMLDGRRSFFVANEPDAALTGRCIAMDVHPTGPMPGRGSSPAVGAALELEQAVLAPEQSLLELLVAERVDHERRSLRLPVRELTWSFDAVDTLELRFMLPRGAFATAVVHELLLDAWDGEEAEGG